MARSNTHRGKTFFWQGLLLLAPVVIFIFVAVLLLRRDRMSVRQEAVENARVLATQIADHIGRHLTSQIQTRYLGALQDEEVYPPGTMISEGSVNIPVPYYYRLLKVLDVHGRGTLDVATSKPRIIMSENAELIWPAPYLRTPGPELLNHSPESSDARARLERARSLAQGGEVLEALPLLNALSAEPLPLFTEAGIPIQPLASLERLRSLQSLETASVHTAAVELASNAVTRSSLITPLLLEEAAQAVSGDRPDSTLAPGSWQKQWAAEEEARSMHAHLRDAGALTALGGPRSAVWTEWHDESWLVLHASELTANDADAVKRPFVGLQFYPKPLVELGLLELLDSLRLRTPPYAGISFEIAGRQLPTRSDSVVLAEYPMTLETRGRPDLVEELIHKGTGLAEVVLPSGSNAVVLAEASATWENETRPLVVNRFRAQPAALPDLLVRVHLSRPDVLFAVQRKRERVFGGLIAFSVATALIGWVAAYLAFRRQLQLNEQKSNFVSSVSHELRAPIASVRLMAEGLERGKVKGAQKQAEYFQFISHECRRLSSLVENVLDFSRIEQGRKQYDFEPTDLLALTRDTVRLMEPYAAERDVKLTLETTSLDSRPSTLDLIADGRALQQALINLIDNAIKHSPKGETVAVSLEAQNSEAGDQKAEVGIHKSEEFRVLGSAFRVHVSDHGPGIPVEEHDKIFERFHRLGSELRRETQGVGIGLSIVKHIVAAHDGRVTVHSAPGQGSRFTIELPVETNHE